LKKKFPKKNQLPNDEFPFGEKSQKKSTGSQTTIFRRLGPGQKKSTKSHQTENRRLATDFFFGAKVSKF
jgi:hypothetical protein